MRKHWLTTHSHHHHLRRGKFVMHDAYKLPRGPVVNVPWRGLIYHNAACPKHIFILWLALLGRIRSKDLLLRWGLEKDTTLGPGMDLGSTTQQKENCSGCSFESMPGSNCTFGVREMQEFFRTST
ncbi:hypothetical protein HAX54_015363 [Datura stramonium]|uniref:Reverse transcriptase zinc-binding domain-containing protein n=1 Tax=Datura stramonium TaxID=4076 RepID=A0ABS8S000_DATST|nr:hypothetical protein [Datura stramonium]